MSSDVKQTLAVVYESDNGRDGWRPVKPEDVPAWVKDPKVMAHLLDGQEAMDCGEGTTGSKWYRAMPYRADDAKPTRTRKTRAARRPVKPARVTH